MGVPVKLNARDMIIEISLDGSVPTPTWVEIGGLSKFVYNPSENEEVADTTTFKSKGQYEQEKMQVGATAELEGIRIADDETGVLDPGQAACEVLHDKLGPASVGWLRFRGEIEQTWKIWRATCTIGEGGGENNDKDAFAATFTRSGPSTSAPVAP